MRFYMSNLLKVLLGGFFILSVIEGVIIWNLVKVNHVRLQARSIKNIKSEHNDQTKVEQISDFLRTKAALYNQHISNRHLLDGMVVNRNAEGQVSDTCDSLLFSALRYRSLLALDFDKDAEEAFDALTKSHSQGRWWRHPRCKSQSLSRDMMMGVLIALSTNPKLNRPLLQDLLSEIDRHNGKFSDGPFFVSYLSPGPAGLLRGISELAEIPNSQLPWVIQQSFSSIEYDAAFLKPGYESHLAALGLWLELELQQLNAGFNPRSTLGEIAKLALKDPHLPLKFDTKRQQWVAFELANQSPRNLFFRYLYLKTFGLLTQTQLLDLGHELIEMPQFPIDQPPSDCNRDADYLWQRADREYDPIKRRGCGPSYAGVDYLWMAGLIYSELK
jgi:hypothetical protein